jgi:hypothetical protein
VSRTLLLLLISLAGLVVLTACTVSTSLVPAMAEEDGRFGIDTAVRQPFYSDSNGLHKLTIQFNPESTSGSQVPVDPAQGAGIELNYAPEEDPRFPEPSFHQWPEHQEWLPELTGDITYEQTFCTPYPDLSGIEVRVATFGADLSAGTGLLEPLDTVEVLHLPVVGDHVGYLPGGSEVEVVGSTEGWARVVLGEEERGWIDMDHFEDLPEPTRTNYEDVLLQLFELEGNEPVRESVINADEMYDISHVSFDFPVVEDALDECYRFRLTSPESEPGNAITLRYDPDGPYDEGQAILNGEPAAGDIVFQPRYDLQEPLYSGYLDDYEWAAPLNAFEARFDPVENTEDRYLEVRVTAGNAPVSVPWSRNRPPGQRPLEVIGDSDAPGGGIIFNAAFQRDIPVAEVAQVTSRDLVSRARMDQPFYVGMALLLVTTVVIGGILWRRSEPYGR